MKGKPPVKILDIVILIIGLGLTLYYGYAVYVKPGSISQVLVQGPNEAWVFPLDAEETLRVRGFLGDDTVVRIHNGEVWAEYSPCKNQLCVGMGRINASSWLTWIACLPNNVMIVIEGKNDRGYTDASAW